MTVKKMLIMTIMNMIKVIMMLILMIKTMMMQMMLLMILLNVKRNSLRDVLQTCSFVEIMLTPQSRAHSKYERSVAPYAPAP